MAPPTERPRRARADVASDEGCPRESAEPCRQACRSTPEDLTIGGNACHRNSASSYDIYQRRFLLTADYLNARSSPGFLEDFSD